MNNLLSEYIKKRQIVEEEIKSFSREFSGEEEILSFLEEVETLVENNKSSYSNLILEAIEIPFPHEDDYVTEIVLRGERLENDEEYNKRLKTYQDAIDHEYRQFLRLKEKFEGKEN